MHRLSLLAILLIALFLRLYHFDYLSVWDDEARTYLVSAATSPVNVLKMQQLQIPANPPLDPLIRHFFMRIGGDNTFFFTLPSLVFSLFGILCSFILARRLFGFPAAIITAFLLTIHPLDITYAQEARNYAILSVVVPLASLAFLKAMETKRTLHWLLYSLSLTFCFYSHLLTLGVAITHGIYVMLRMIMDYRDVESPRGTLRVLISYMLALSFSILLFLPWLLPYLSREINPWDKGPAIIYFNLWRVVMMFNSGMFRVIPIALTLTGLYALFRREKRENTLFVILNILVLYAASYMATKNNFFHIRYVYFILPFFLMITAHGILFLSEMVSKLSRVGFLKIGYVAGMILLVLSLNNARHLYAGYQYGWEDNFDGDWRGAAEYVHEHFREGDAIVVPHRLHANFDTYNKLPTYGFEVTDQQAKVIPSHEITENSLTGREWGIIMYNNRYPDYNSDIAGYISSKKYSRLWVIWNFEFKLTKEDLFLSLLFKYGKPVDVKKLKGVVVTLWEISPK